MNVQQQKFNSLENGVENKINKTEIVAKSVAKREYFSLLNN